MADQKSHIIVDCIYSIVATPTTSCKETSLIDDVMWTDMNFALGGM